MDPDPLALALEATSTIPSSSTPITTSPVPTPDPISATTTTMTTSISAAVTLKILITGDSMTQGSEGDYTWRYRLWDWLRQTAGPTTRFVGPYTGTHDAVAPHPPRPPPYYGHTAPRPQPRVTGGYARAASPAWSSSSSSSLSSSSEGGESRHFALWGQAAREALGTVGPVVAADQPDLVLVALGFNDMAHCISDWEGTVGSLRRIVGEARVAKPDVRIVLATVPKWGVLEGREDLRENTRRFNVEIRRVVGELCSVASPVGLAEMAREYDCGFGRGGGGYDGLHPNALGEWQIAKAFSDALVEFGVRREGIRLPLDGTGEYAVRTPDNVVADGAPMGVTVTWDKVYGSRGYDWRCRLKGWSEWQEGWTEANRLDITWTVADIEWEVQIRATRGRSLLLKSDWSDRATATSRRNTPPPPKEISVEARDEALALFWSPTGQPWEVDRYEVILLDRETPGAIVETFCFGTAGAGFISGLKNGRQYSIWMSTWAIVDGQQIGGLPEHAGDFVPGT